jgi:hypothetical protein
LLSENPDVLGSGMGIVAPQPFAFGAPFGPHSLYEYGIASRAYRPKM